MAYKVFLSVGSSFNQVQEDFIKAIEEYLQANDLTPQTVGRTYYSSLQPLKAVNELMKECCGTIILALERSYLVEAVERRNSPKQASLNGLKLTSAWNQIEAAMAYTHGHPLLVIVEAGIKNDGLLEKGYDWYVLEVDTATSLVNDPRFVGVIADWKKRVAQFAVEKAQGKASEGTADAPAPQPVPLPKSVQTSEATNMARVRRNLVDALNDDELADLCFDLNVDYDTLRGDSKNAKVRELVALCERSGRLRELLENCRAIRPNIEW